MIKGKWHPKDSALHIDAGLSVNDLGRYTITLRDGVVYRGDFAKLQVSERLGNVARKIILEDGSVFVSSSNDAIDKLCKVHHKRRGFIHYLETHLGWIAVALIFTTVTAFSFFKWGIPWTSTKIAHALPYETNKVISLGTMDFLDDYIFKESNLTKERQDSITKHFYQKIAPLSRDDEAQIIYKLRFRSWSMSGIQIPNALALPSGDIIVTDKFIELAKSQEEIDSVLLHEMGHVVHRHGLEMMIEGTFVTVAVMMISGDGSSIGDMGIGLGSALVNSSYSRRHESQADLYAFEKMLIAKIDPKAFSTIMNRMSAYILEHQPKGKEAQDDSRILDYFASHPTTKKRVELANHYSDCFKQGLTVCK
jgi:Zn-dependent protease with chaperone function